MKTQPIQPIQPTECTAAELDAVLLLLRGFRPRVQSIVVGSGRDPVSLRNAGALGRAWSGAGGQVLATVDWPEEAASWLRQARRFTAPSPDAWVVTGQAAGWAGMARRLVQSTGWQPTRTVGTAALADPAMLAATGPDTLHGLRGGHRDGSTWSVNRTLLIHHPLC